MRRALLICRKEGLSVIPFPCSFSGSNGDFSADDFFIPSADALSGWNTYLKEIVGYMVTALKY
jgi:uncharacterized SAM-binding protein YcdF (DUF218 family)